VVQDLVDAHKKNVEMEEHGCSPTQEQHLIQEESTLEDEIPQLQETEYEEAESGEESMEERDEAMQVEEEGRMHMQPQEVEEEE
jgi:hypothetical protein